jgi:YesN/AraC family two-component response regulator
MADEAVCILESRNDIRIVFTDIEMPGTMDGMKLAACIRDRWPPVEIILTSGYFAPKDVTLPARGLFFAKPYDPRAVSEAMRRMAGLRTGYAAELIIYRSLADAFDVGPCAP